MLSLHELSFVYQGKGQRPVFTGLNVTFRRGINVLLGPNGAGKTTLMQAIFGLLPYKGRIVYNGENVTAMQPERRLELMSYLPQMDIETSMLTVFEMVLLGRLPGLQYRVPQEEVDLVLTTLQALNIEPLAHRNFSELSGGQKKLVFIAQTLVRQPQLILLDEPVNSLDLQKQLELCRLLCQISHQQQVDILMVLHDINLAARYGEHLVVLNNDGSLYAAGTPNQVVNEEMLREVYGVVARINRDESGVPVVSPIRSVHATSRADLH
ncbi:ABC transporter ATP-binding protein [Desulfobulbus oligotrophicus]|uniref:ABC transporter ATP-binding protein n=1 Tax=Desulfobulbus oligotrophicus TaxID=1909699 RepID=A0A7T6APG7_9BACT|nr:ABC transporter ATP-binding protein [Desulfobulbus oligotrophicus]QQG64686.1 ABC transporter ATP-binding protein [Desulfobulbus oligotrophicus]